MRAVCATVVCGALLSLGGCASHDRPLEQRGPAVAQVVEKLPSLELPEVRMPPPSRADVMTAYRRVYGAVPDTHENQAVGRRLADLEMQAGEDKDAAGEAAPYQAAIDLYESLLQQSGAENLDEVIYQLARAYDVVGNTQQARHYLDRLVTNYPDSRFIVEARFRRAEMAFSAEQYADAAKDYEYVVASGSDTAYWQNANYMLGWCRFKRSQLDESLDSFFVVVDSILSDGKEPDRSTQELLNDALRVIVLAVTYLDGPKTLSQHMDKLHKPA